MLGQAITDQRLGEVVEAIIGLVQYMRFTGTIVPKLLEIARTTIAAGDDLQRARLHSAFGELAADRSDDDTAQARHEEALRLYERSQEPYSVGMVHHRLANLASPGPRRDQHLAAARKAWTSISRSDLIQVLDKEFGSADESS